jgi:putative DNA-binding protein
MARIAEAMRGGFPKLAAAIGDEAFEAMVAAYLEKYPSTRLSVRGAGEHLPAFLAESAHHPVWHGELALLDRAYVDVLDAPRAKPLATANFSPSEPIRLVPAHALIELTTTVDELWRAIATGDVLTRPRELDWPRTVLVWRMERVVLHRAVEADEARALRRAGSGAMLADLCATFTGENPTARALDIVLRWIDDSVVAA